MADGILKLIGGAIGQAVAGIDYQSALPAGTGFIKETPSGTFALSAFGAATYIPVANGTGFNYTSKLVYSSVTNTLTMNTGQLVITGTTGTSDTNALNVFTVVGGVGGAAGSGDAGIGSGFSLTGGVGGLGGGAAAVAGGLGGGFSLTGGKGGDGSGGTQGGKGGSFSLIGGLGGDGTGTAPGGIGGDIYIAGGEAGGNGGDILGNVFLGITPSNVLSGNVFIQHFSGLLKGTSGVVSAITDNSANWNTAYGWGQGLKLDQTTPQTVINGSPIFNVGLKIIGNTKFNLFQGAGAQAADLTYTLPVAQPPATSQFLQCTTGGILSWETVSTATPTLQQVMTAGATTGTQLTSTLAIGTSPFAVTSTTVNTNLNADLLDGLHASGLAYLPIAGGTLTGNLLFTDATYDIGATGATRPRDLFLSRNLTVGSLTATRIPYVSTAGLLIDSANLTFDGTDITQLGNYNFGGTAARQILHGRAISGVGNNFTVQAGGSQTVANLAGGNLILSSGISTGDARSAIWFYNPKAGISGSTDRTPVASMRLDTFATAGTSIGRPRLILSDDSTFALADTVNAANALQVYSNGIGGVRIMVASDTDTTGVANFFARSRGTLSGIAAVQTLDRIGAFSFQGYDSAATPVVRSVAQIKCEVMGTVGSNRVPGNLTFLTATDTAPGVLTAGLRLDCAQNAYVLSKLYVGSLTTTPLEQVHVSDTIRADTAFNLNGTDGITDSAAGTIVDVHATGGIVTAVTRVTPAADGTYVTGLKLTPVTGTDGSITIANGIITNIVAAT